jgi:pimeloyl-ACP methyl ester carboxylesterase
MHYADNCVDSDVMVCYLHGAGLDASDFSRHLETADYRAVAPTLYGFERLGNRHIRLSIANHLVILREWLRQMVEHDAIKAIVLVGFSTGSDLWLEYACRPVFDPSLPVLGLITLDPNVTLETCWATRILAELSHDTPTQILDKLRSLSAGTKSLNEWLNIQEYLVRVLRKFRGNIEVLTQFTTEIVECFKGSGLELFAQRFRAANSTIPYVRHVFSGATSEAEAIAAIKLANLDSGFLGEGYTAGSFVIEADTDHFDLIDPARLNKHVDLIVAKCRAHRREAAACQVVR